MSPLDAHQAWHRLSEELQQELPRQTYALRLGQARLLEASSEGYTVALPDEETRAWVADRLQALMERSLRGITNQAEIRLQFVVHPAGPKQPDESLEPPETDPEQEYHLLTDYASVREAIIRPERIVAVPGYLLRWLAYLDPENAKLRHARGWLLVALHQAFYSCHRTPLQDHNYQSAFTASGNELADLSGMTRQSVQNHLRRLRENPCDPLRWFIEPLENTPVPGLPNPANRYRFHLALPLTPGDADALRTWLTAHGLHEDPLGCLAEALTVERRRLLPFPAPAPTAEQRTRLPRPQNVQQVVLEQAGLSPSDARYPQLVLLADRLATRLLPPSDRLLITHYFLQHWLPRLGHGPAWLVTVLRDRGYINKETGEIRDTVHYRNGYAPLANLLGLTETDTIGRWLSPAVRDQLRPLGAPVAETAPGRYEDIRQLTDLFLEKKHVHIDHHPAGQGGTEVAFKVALDEVLLPEHQAFYAGLLQLLHLTARLVRPEWLALAFSTDCVTEAEVAAQILQGSTREFDSLHPAQRAYLTPEPANLPREFDTVDAGRRASLTEVNAQVIQLKALNKYFTPQTLKNLQHLIDQLLPQKVSDTESFANGKQPVGVGEWDIPEFLEAGGIKPEIIREVKHKLATATMQAPQMLAWLLYGYANRQHGIRNPAAFALDRYPNQPDPLYLRLARLTPRELQRQILSRHGPQTQRPLAEVLAALETSGILELAVPAVG